MLACVVHELLHVALQPNGAVVYIGLIPKQMLFYMKCKEPLSKKRFIAMSLLPMILGLIPFVLFLIMPVEYRISSSILWPMVMVGLVSPSPDYCNVYHVVKEVPAEGSIQDGEDGLYWFLKE